MRIDKEYRFETEEGAASLRDLFSGRSQLLVPHMMFPGCPSCASVAAGYSGFVIHLENHDVSFVRVSRAPLARIEAFNERMGWHARWVSSFDSNFNRDFHVSFTKDELAKGEAYYNYKTTKSAIEELSGLSVFTRDASQAPVPDAA